MPEAAVIKGSYADYRRVKGRKTLQLVIEVPLEQAPLVHEAFGEPLPDGSTWVAVALLDSSKAPEQPAKTDHHLSRQAAMCCNDKMFQVCLSELYDTHCFNSDQAADIVRQECLVDSRAEFDTNPEAAARWRNLHASYEAWKNV